MNHSQRLIAEEAAKFGAKKVSKLDTVAEVVNRSIEEASKPVYRAGDKVQVPFNGKMVTGKVVRFDSGGTDKARQHGGGYVVDVGARGSVTIPAHLVRAVKEEVEADGGDIAEAFSIGTKSYEIQRDQFSKKEEFVLYRLSYNTGSVRFSDGRKGTPIGNFKSKQDAMAAAKKDAGVKEEVEQVDEQTKNYVCFYNRKQIVVQASSSYEAQQKAGAALKVPPKKQYMIAVKLAEDTQTEATKEIKDIGLRTDFRHPKGKAVVTKSGKVVAIYKTERAARKHALTGKPMKEEVDEAYAPASVPLNTLLGAFTIKGATKFRDSSQGRFEYRLSQDSWGKSHGLPHEVCVSSKASGAKGDWRAANVKGTVCIIATDEGPDGKPVLEKWAITRHVKYVNAEGVEHQEDTNVFEAISLAGMGFKKRSDASGTSRVGRLEKVSADQLTKVFGPPHSKKSGDGKTTMEWRFVNSAGLVFTVYDYNNPPKSNSAPHNWSVGGIKDAHKISIQRAFRMMGVPGKMIKEDVDENTDENTEEVDEAFNEKSRGKFKVGDKVTTKSSSPVKGTIVRFEPSAKGSAAVIKTDRGTTLTSSLDNIKHG